MNCETAQKLFESLEGREVLVICKPSAGGGMPGYNLAGKLTRGKIKDVWELHRVGLDPSEHPQIAKTRTLIQFVDTSDVGGVTELGELSAISPAGIIRPSGGPAMNPNAFR